MTKIILVDGSSYLHRAFHALPSLSNQIGEPTGALYGCLNMLRKLMREEVYDYFAVIIDHPSKNFRHNIYPQYKANRKTLPDELIFQIKALPELIKALGVTLISEPGVEADDVIATITEQAVNKNWEVLIATGDKDLMQLVNSQVNLLNTMNNEQLDIAKVIERYSVRPDQIVDYLMLIGDSSDNIPGVEKVGPKTAVKWLNQYSDLNSLLEHQDEIKGKIGEYLKKAIPFFLVTKQLITLKRDVSLNFSLEELTVKPPCLPLLKELYHRYNFKVWLDELTEPFSSAIAQSNGDFLINAPLFAFYFINKQTVVFAVKEKFFVTQDFKLINKILSQNNSLKLTFDIKYTLNFVENLPEKIIDINLANYLVDSNQNNTDLKKLAKFLLNINYELEKSAWIIWQIYQKINLDDNLRKILIDIEQPLSKILFSMEKKGVLVDLNWYNYLNLDITNKIKKISEKIFLIVPDFNLNSPNQLQKILYENLKLPIVKKTPKGQPSTSEETLEELIDFHPIILLILQYRELAKLKSTYLDPLPNLLDNKNRLHTTFHQNVTITGRLSSSNPNLQNIPVRTTNGRLFRKLFIAPAGKKLLSADYSQIELRIMAHLSNDPLMIEGYQNNLDLHSLVAQEIFPSLPEDIARQKAKTINFGLIYGMSPFGLAKRLGVTLHEAKSYINFYFERFPNVKTYMQNIKYFAKQHGYVTSILGRKFYLKDINAKNFNLKSAAERLAINAGIQGSAAEIIKIAMIKLDNALVKFSETNLLLQIHDELLLEIPEDKIFEIQKIVEDTMENVLTLNVPLKVNITVGNSWKE